MIYSLAGACGALSFVLTSSGILAWANPSGNILGPVSRILDSVSPWLLLFGFTLACLTLALRLRVLGFLLIVFAMTSAAVQFSSYRKLTVPLDQNVQADIRVLFFNALASNSASSRDIVSATLDADADIVVFAEASALRPSMDELRASYKFVSSCSEDACELIAATNLDVIRFWRLQLNPIWSERYAVLEFVRPDGETAFLAASHLVKPWFSGVSEPEIEKLVAQYNWLSGPSLAIGDFNMAPWSRPMRGILDQTGFRAVRGQPATWPAFPGPIRLPIDQLLVRDRVRVVNIETFGGHLRSNHLGIIADIAFK
ncbi:MAG: endonuclease/exonuclease/phosphatase family protein [Pseudomonadota bacterium]